MTDDEILGKLDFPVDEERARYDAQIGEHLRRLDAIDARYLERVRANVRKSFRNNLCYGGVLASVYTGVNILRALVLHDEHASDWVLLGCYWLVISGGIGLLRWMSLRLLRKDIEKVTFTRQQRVARADEAWEVGLSPNWTDPSGGDSHAVE